MKEEEISNELKKLIEASEIVSKWRCHAMTEREKQIANDLDVLRVRVIDYYNSIGKTLTYEKYT